MSESEPRMTRRNVKGDIKTRVASRSWDELGGFLLTGPSGVRRTRGMSLVQAFVRNVGTLPMMSRENPISGSPTKGESIDAPGGGGTSSSSD